jgi:CDGSH-type Zn-finger protein
MSREEPKKENEQRKLRVQQMQVRVLANKPFMDGVHQGLEDERQGKGVRSKDLKRTDGGH